VIDQLRKAVGRSCRVFAVDEVERFNDPAWTLRSTTV
jgi:hypothetical protein